LNFTASGTSGTLATPCNTSLLGFGTAQSVTQDFSYDSSYYQLGGMLQWHNPNWSVRGGYQYQYWQRNNVDALVVSNGGVPYQSNNIVVADVARKVSDHVALFVRGQLMSNQFVGEIPFAYNSLTASKFALRYGFATFGVTMEY
jgi:hypothetical protein